jgi:ubiquinone/menaquinone biosynthesis C-methylase UbiE
MNFYREQVLPHLLHFAMRRSDLAEYRMRLIPQATGRVLEIGIGSGLNLPYYGAHVERVLGLDPSSKLLAMIRNAADKGSVPVELIEGSAEEIPLARQSIDTIVSTWTLCSVPDVARSVRDMRRVLKPDGRLLFVEHGLSPDRNVRAWQNRVTPLWERIGGGCHLNRPVDSILKAGGLRLERLETGYIKGPKILTFMFEGSARTA